MQDFKTGTRPPICVAILQHGYQGSAQATLEHTTKLLAQAKERHPQLNLVVLPELHPYPYFCQHEDPKYFAWAKDFKAQCNFLSALAKAHEVVLVGSLFEERMVGVYHNSAVVFEKDGKLLGVQRKMHIPDDPRFYEKFYFTPGDKYAPIASSVGNLGVLVCWDQWYPEAARLMALQKADILIYPSAIGWFCDEESEDLEEKALQRQAWMGVQRGHSIANTIPVIASNRVGFESDPSGKTSGLEFFGSSFVFGAFGKELAQAGFEEEILYACIDLDESARVRQMWPFFRDRRIDTYKPLIRRVVD
ncbi:carbon-nitrogen hydrolase [Helicobacter ailurogastricus]|uniref:N-carbamoylputrescine amidase n=1 Tax=Helicobacter ailurogastricus TaxID=1578720 RepID=A0A0K2Y6R9_9HELI|nr:carbon-nitrogen hydrolase [Helicobacter ailurogastricus]BDQ28738.1 N-carbamoylputrescine amidase [Helicobacter ailurogastricus]CRI32263.1 N-carbamoylputrescine amidase [Helicobacter ailurogastricus]